jgi:hypothetical protein
MTETTNIHTRDNATNLYESPDFHRRKLRVHIRHPLEVCAVTISTDSENVLSLGHPKVR